MTVSFNPSPKPSYKTSKPPKNMPSKLRKGIKQRDGNTCQMCGKQGEYSDMGLTIHHIVSPGMGRRKVHKKENLITLCGPVFGNKCHHETHSGKESEELQRWCESWSRKKYGAEIDRIKKQTKKGNKAVGAGV